MTKTFRDLGVHPALCDALETQNITHPFPIQELTLPLALGGHDLIGQARTGTGKTLAFGLPLLQRLDATKAVTQALVVVPTRELCLQVYEDLKIGAALGVTSISVYGGVGYDEQIDALTTGVHVVVGTPGRLLDHLNRRNLDLSQVTQLVLDEADEMLDMGFLPDVERLVEACQGTDRHTMLFSATMPTPIVKLARRYMDHPTFTRADYHEERETAPNVEQHFFQVHRMDKPRLLARLLQDEDRGGVYVFVRTKHMADRLVGDLEELQTPAIAIHGDLRQSQREKNLDRFRSGKATVLVATAVAARGLDVHGVTHVVNYDCPDDEKMYLHRIGRTARAGESGKAITFAEFNEVDRLNVIRKKVGATESELTQIFSTSPVLEELFTLPAERPWDHLVAAGREREDQRRKGSGARRGAAVAVAGAAGAGAASSRSSSTTPASGRSTAGRSGSKAAESTRSRGGRSGSTRSTATEPDAPTGAPAASEAEGTRERSAPRQGRTDGRPKGGREREGRGRDRDAVRDRTARPDAGADRSERNDRSPSTGVAPDVEVAPDDAASDDTPRTRTRTRTRTRSATGDRTDSANGNERGGARSAAAPTAPAEPSEAGQDRAPAGDGADRADDTARSTSTSTSTSGRTRARARGRGRASSGGGSGRQDGTDRSADERTGADPVRTRSEDRDDTSGGGRSGNRDASREGGRDGRRGSSSRSGRSSSRDSGSRDSGGRSQPRGGSRDSAGRSSGSGGEDRSSDREAGVVITPRGEDARGEGQPQRARRVHVEHLP